eukprot:TRINITY_DN475_c0_g2_i7.p1 TRINITY_DN475_c0_g2~~TRINITY_DN475_c0_g2_i7.p1  ORF type:complete len:112 (+),score=20.65 TRINITY_DN475_c0_g2_i7:49-336(+)
MCIRDRFISSQMTMYEKNSKRQHVNKFCNKIFKPCKSLNLDLNKQHAAYQAPFCYSLSLFLGAQVIISSTLMMSPMYSALIPCLLYTSPSPRDQA